MRHYEYLSLPKNKISICSINYKIKLINPEKVHLILLANYVIGKTLSIDFPIKLAFQSKYGGDKWGGDAFVTKLSATSSFKYTLTITKAGSGTGTVNVIGCTLIWNWDIGTCTVAEGTNITISTQPDPGSVFAGWSNGTGSASGCTGTGACTSTTKADSSITANFHIYNTPNSSFL